MIDRVLRAPPRVFALAAAAYCGMIFGLSSIPGASLGVQSRASAFAFNFAHGPLYCGLGALVALALVERDGAPPFRFGARRAVLAVLLTMVYALADEWHQSFVAGRSPDAVDSMTDLGGATFAVLLTALLVGAATSKRKALALKVAMAGCVLLSVSSSLAATFGSTSS